jgi:hypothetical protein
MRKCLEYQAIRPKEAGATTIADELFDSDDERDEDDEEAERENKKPKQIEWQTVWRILAYNKDGWWMVAAVLALQLLRQPVELQQEYLINQWGLDSLLQTNFESVVSHT